MATAFESGDLLLGIVGIVVLEAIALVVLARRFEKRLGILDVSFHLAAGAFLLLATRSAVLGEAWTVTLSWVTASLPVHLIDLWRRFAR